MRNPSSTHEDGFFYGNGARLSPPPPSQLTPTLSSPAPFSPKKLLSQRETVVDRSIRPPPPSVSKPPYLSLSLPPLPPEESVRHSASCCDKLRQRHRRAVTMQEIVCQLDALGGGGLASSPPALWRSRGRRFGNRYVPLPSPHSIPPSVPRLRQSPELTPAIVWLNVVAFQYVGL